ncbi:MAG: RNA methyltransferase [Ignavibacteriales bacterium]|nr:RNA methyltransferase [Ignavibacteriales bacterium]
MTGVVRHRQSSLHLVLENIHDPHNVSAIFRSADAVGVPLISLLYNFEKFPKIGKKSSASAFKWVDRRRFTAVEECYETLHNEGFAIYATTLKDESLSIYDVDFTKPCAIVMGNEHRGISDEVASLADKTIYIPMMGMVQSLNVSVATAVVLYEIMRQRQRAGMYDSPTLTEEQYLKEVERYLRK